MIAKGRSVYISGDCEIDLARRELRILGSPVPVGGRAFEMIEVLAQSVGQLVTKDELMNRIWPGAVVMENTVQVHAAAVRKALGPYKSLLKTEYARGYRLLGDWTVIHPDEAQPSISVRQTRVTGEPQATNNFPAAITRLVGRSSAVQSLQDLVSAYRIVTLTGPGGIGKTALALSPISPSDAILSNLHQLKYFISDTTKACLPAAGRRPMSERSAGWVAPTPIPPLRPSALGLLGWCRMELSHATAQQLLVRGLLSVLCAVWPVLSSVPVPCN
jgi:DNA-binding winged helix-turn-helix (wHTH) protein